MRRLAADKASDNYRVQPAWLASLRVAGIYALVAWGWIVLSDRMLYWLYPDAEQLTWLQTAKGGFFVAATALLLAWLVRRDLAVLQGEVRSCEKVQESFRALVETIPHGIQECDVNGVITYTNAAYDRIFGLEPGEALGTTIWDKYANEEESARLRDYILSLVEVQPEPVPYITRNLVKSGGMVDIQVDWNYLRDAQGELIGFASIITDITERRKAEEAIRASDRLKSELISTAAHEFRTPLTTIQGYTELLLDGHEFSAEERREYLGSIYRKSVSLADMVDNLLDLSRVEAGQPLPMRITPCSVTSLWKEVAPFTRTLEVQYRVEVDLEEPETVVRIDRGKIVQVLENLLSNAAKYSAGGSTIALRGRRFAEGYRFAVIDQGIGMNAEQVSRIFERFYRVNSSDSSPAGLGIGLAIVKAIIDAHGSAVHVESIPGRGTSFSFDLPLASDAAQQTSSSV